jgi:O-methyltransferase
MNASTQRPTLSATPDATVDALYLDLLKRCLTRHLFIDEEVGNTRWGWQRTVTSPLHRMLGKRNLKFGRVGGDPSAREFGRDWPVHAETMIGLRRLENIEACVTDVVRRDVPGDLIETGVWRGGSTIFMRAILAVLGDATRRVWVADSFQGLPRPNAIEYPEDAQFDARLQIMAKLGMSADQLRGARLFEMIRQRFHDPILSVTLEEVRKNFVRYGLLDNRVQFLPGWFADTLPSAPIEQLAVMRLDGDLYESTIDALDALYPKLSPGGYVIVDDYGSLKACRQAVDDYRADHGVTDEIMTVDQTGVYWKRT